VEEVDDVAEDNRLSFRPTLPPFYLLPASRCRIPINPSAWDHVLGNVTETPPRTVYLNGTLLELEPKEEAFLKAETGTQDWSGHVSLFSLPPAANILCIISRFYPITPLLDDILRPNKARSSRRWGGEVRNLWMAKRNPTRSGWTGPGPRSQNQSPRGWHEEGCCIDTGSSGIKRKS